MKICTECLRQLPDDEFYTLKNGRKQSGCKACYKARANAWHANNKTRSNESSRRWREANPDKVREILRANYAKNKPTRLASMRLWRASHQDAQDREKQRAAAKRWREKPGSKEAVRLNQRKWRSMNPSKARAKERRWRQAHPELVRAQVKKRRAVVAGAPISDFTAAQWAALQIAFAHACAYCGKRRKGKLTQDHVIPLSKGGAHTASNIVPACSSCNSKKHTGPLLTPIQPPLL